MNPALKPLILTSLAMIAFAANSVLARYALLAPDIGAWTYTSVRLVSGTLVLVLLTGPTTSWKSGSWTDALYLLTYAGFFSLAYVSLPAGIGALILFTAVQITMIGSGLINGERLSALQTLGALSAFAGLALLLNPGIDAPSLWGALMMTSSGIGWGLYSLKGRMSQNSTRDTSGNFLKATILAIIIALPYLALNAEPVPQFFGIGLAIISGALTSGLGYVIWYAALPHLSAVRAGLSQLSVPAIAAAGGVLLLSEPMSARLIVSSVVILIGVGVATLSRSK